MKDFDALPPELRRALAYADHNWSGTDVRRLLRSVDAAILVDVLQMEDKQKHETDAEAGFVCGGQR
jgi:hypothetical protein